MYKCVTIKRHICKAVVMGITTVKGFFEHLFNSSVKQLFAQLKTLESNAFLKKQSINTWTDQILKSLFLRH